MFSKTLSFHGRLKLPSLDHAERRSPSMPATPATGPDPAEGDLAKARPSRGSIPPTRVAPPPEPVPSHLLDCRLNGSPWDDQTILDLCENSRLMVRITYVERRFRSGTIPDGGMAGSPFVLTATGVLQCPGQHVHVQIDFADAVEGYGLAFLTRAMSQRHGGEPVAMPLLRIVLDSADHHAQTGLLEAHRDALRSGAATSDFALWYEPVPNGWFSRQSDNVYGKLSFTGSLSWSDLGSDRIERWALPIEHEGYSLADFAEPHRLRRAKPGP